MKSPPAALSGKEKRKERLRQDILRVASELFAEEGYEHTTMRRIAERLEYTQGAIYFYFKDKAEILTAICQDTFAGLNARFDEISATVDDPVERLVACSRAIVAFGRQHPHHYRTVFSAPSRWDGRSTADVIGELGDQTFQRFRRLMQDCIDSGRVRPVPRTEAGCLGMGVSWWCAITGVTQFLISQEHSDWVPHDRVLDELLTTLVRGILADPPQA